MQARTELRIIYAMTSEENHRWQFLKAVLRQPRIVGAIAPSSTAVSAELAAVVPKVGWPLVVELGPGTGSVTDAIAACLPAGGRHLAVEVDDELVTHLRRTRPHVETIWGDACDLGALLDSADADRVDAVVCALPWSLIGEGKQREILDQMAEVLVPGGVVSVLAYPHAHWLPRARDFRSALNETFEEVVRSAVVWPNAPPAVVYTCRRPVSRVLSR